MTSVPARQLSGDHLGKTVEFESRVGPVSGSLDEVLHQVAGSHGSMLRVNNGIATSIRWVLPDTPVTIEEDQ